MTDATHRRNLRILAAIIAATLLSTTLHYAHNIVELDQYPGTDFAAHTPQRIFIGLAWVALTAIGLYGYRLYRERRFARAHVAIAIYSLVGWGTLGHFPAGWPDIPAFWLATIFTDAIVAALLIGFVAASRRGLEPTPAHVTRRSG